MHAVIDNLYLPGLETVLRKRRGHASFVAVFLTTDDSIAFLAARSGHAKGGGPHEADRGRREGEGHGHLIAGSGTHFVQE